MTIKKSGFGGGPVQIRSERLGDSAPIRPKPLHENMGSSRSTYSLLRLELAQRQLTLHKASQNVRKGLATTPTISTKPEFEGAAREFWGDVHQGDLDGAQNSITPFLKTLPIAELPKFLDVLQAQRSAALTEVFGDELKHLAWTSETALDNLSKSLLQTLPATEKPTNHREAMQTMVQQSDVLDLGFSPTAVYPAVNVEYEDTNSFTNEPGLPELVCRVEAEGGAAVGVGGALFDIASMGSSFIVSIDANPKVKDTIQLFTAILLAVDQKCQAHGLDDDQRAAEVLGFLEGGYTKERQSQLQDVGLPVQLTAQLPAMLAAIKSKLAGESTEALPIPQDLWCRGASAPQRIAHLTSLALEGRIVAMTGDLADERISDRVNGLLRAHDTETKVVHFSNALDYVPDIKGACEVFGQLDLMPGAEFTTSTGWRFRDPINTAKPDGYSILSLLGTTQKPANNSAEKWLKPGGLGSMLHGAMWETSACVRNLVEWTADVCGVDANAFSDRSVYSVQTYKETAKAMETEAFKSPERVKGFVLSRLKDRGRYKIYARAAPGLVEKMLEPLPRSFAEIDAVIDRIDAEFWDHPQRKIHTVQFMLRDTTAIPDTALNQVLACRSFDEIQATSHAIDSQ